MLAAIAALTGLLMFDGSTHISTRMLRSVVARATSAGVKAPAAAEEAVGGAMLQANGAYIAVFILLATQVIPNFESVIVSMNRLRVVSAAVSMLVPAGLVAAYGRKLI